MKLKSTLFVFVLLFIFLASCSLSANSEKTTESRPEPTAIISTSSDATQFPADTATPSVTPTEAPSPTWIPLPTLVISPPPTGDNRIEGYLTIPVGEKFCKDFSDGIERFARDLFNKAKGNAFGIFDFFYSGEFSSLPNGLSIETISEPERISHCLITSPNMPPGIYYLPYFVEVWDSEINAEGTTYFKVNVLSSSLPSILQGDPFAFVSDFNITGETEPSAFNIFLLSEDGTGMYVLTRDGRADPAWSPDGKQLAYSVYRSGSQKGIILENLENGDIIQLSEDGGYPAWSSDGKNIAYIENGYLNIIYINDFESFDILTVDFFAVDGFSWSPDSQHIVFYDTSGGNQPTADIYIVDINTLEIASVFSTSAASIDHIRWSPAGNNISFVQSKADKTVGLYVINIDGSGLRELSSLGKIFIVPAAAPSPAWSPDGTKIAFVKDISGTYAKRSLNIINADGTGLKSVLENSSNFTNIVWIDDGTRLAFIAEIQDNVRQVSDTFGLYTINIDGTKLTQLFENGGGNFGKIRYFTVP